MKTARSIVAILMVVGAFVVKASAQLAITEVMSETSSFTSGSKEPDYWELTNFAETNINLHGYGFHDNQPARYMTNIFDHLEIGPRESVIFFRSNDVFPTAESFKKWWWPQNFSPTQELKIRIWQVGGIDGDTGDEIWVYDSKRFPVAKVSFDKAVRGRSFTYSPETGEFGATSFPDVHGAFRAASATNDVGSPGFTTGPTPLIIHVQPISQTNDVCGRAAFSIVASGMPPPSYQWTHDGIEIPEATAATYVIPVLDLSDAGEYGVILNNGLTNLASATAFLAVTTNPKAPKLNRSLSDITVFPGQAAVFEAEAQGYPCLQYQWSSNGIPLIEATNQTLSISIPDDASPTSRQYSVVISNQLGSISTSATLKVVRRPCLMLTEIFVSAIDGPLLGHKNWFELTNCDTNTVDLLGYRFRDSAVFDVAWIINSPTFIRPGESIVFVEAMSPDAFKRWWGASNLAPDLQIITWGGWGLSVQSATDPIHVWNATPKDGLDTVATENRLAAMEGFSQFASMNDCAPDYGCIGWFLDYSFEGERGAFRAVEGGDIGSPGYAAFPRVLGISKMGPSIRIRCLVEPGKAYRLMASEQLIGSPWLEVTAVPAGNAWMTTIDTSAGDAATRFYRLEELQ